MGYLNSSGYYAWFSFVKSLPVNSEFGTSAFDILNAKRVMHISRPSPKHTMLSSVKGTLQEGALFSASFETTLHAKMWAGDLISHKTEKCRASGSIRCWCEYANDFRNEYLFNILPCVQT